jgi:transposase
VRVSRGSELTDAQWEVIVPLMPQVVEGIVYRYRCWIAWRDLPERFGPWQTVWKRHERFSTDGTWGKILTAVLAQADAAGDIDWAVSIDSTINRAHRHATSLPRSTGAVSKHRNPRVEPAELAAIRVPRLGPGRPRTRPDAVLADKAHPSKAIRAELRRRRGITSVIPEPADQQGHRKRRGSRGGRPVTYDRNLYKGRNVVERAFNLLKQWRELPSSPGYELRSHVLNVRAASPFPHVLVR